jgi:hypothetical protein
MEDLPTSMLLQQESAKPRTGEELETFGKYAARRFLDRECKTLTEAVVDTVKSASLAPEQVKRVVEFANTAAYLQKFASAGPQHKVVSFEGGPASFPDVLRDLNDGGNETVLDKAASIHDYLLPPPDTRALEVRNLERLGVENEKIAEAFGVVEVPLPFEEPLQEAYGVKMKLASLYDEASSDINQLESHHLTVCDELFQHVKQAALAGSPLGHVVVAMKTACEDPEFMKAAFQVLGPRLIENGVFKTGAELADSLMKTAGAGHVNPNHPIVDAYRDFAETLAKLAATRTVQNDVLEQLDIVSTFLKKASQASDRVGQVEEVLAEVPKVWRAARDTAATVAEPTRRLVSAATGSPVIGRLAGGAVKYAPHAGVYLAGEAAYQRLKNNPAADAAGNFVMSRLPYTRQHQIREYNFQS